MEKYHIFEIQEKSGQYKLKKCNKQTNLIRVYVNKNRNMYSNSAQPNLSITFGKLHVADLSCCVMSLLKLVRLCLFALDQCQLLLLLQSHIKILAL